MPVSDDEADDNATGVQENFSREFQTLLGLFDTPAYVKRALAMQAALASFERQCQSRRYEWQEGVRMRLRSWNAASALKPAFAGSLGARIIEQIRELNEQLLADEPATSSWAKPMSASAAWKDLLESVERFNQRWSKFAEAIDASHVNRLIDGYNRHYVIEKEFAIRSSILAQRGFQPLAMVTPIWILDRFPLLPSLRETADMAP